MNAALLLLSVSALAQAQAHLAQGRLDRVLIDLDQPGPSPSDEARVLSQAAERAKARKDEPMALLLMQKAQQRDPSQPRPVRLLGEWSLAAREFGQARRYAALWLKLQPDDDAARRFSLKVQLLAESWHPALLEKPRHRRGGLVRPARVSAPVEDPGAPYKDAAARPIVAVYGTSWCPACRAAREYLIKRHIPFADYDLERDPGARQELAAKQAKAGVHFGGVPVLDVNGTLMEGFDASAIDDALLH